jgi:hypothetical protein
VNEEDEGCAGGRTDVIALELFAINSVGNHMSGSQGGRGEEEKGEEGQ